MPKQQEGGKRGENGGKAAIRDKRPIEAARQRTCQQSAPGGQRPGQTVCQAQRRDAARNGHNRAHRQIQSAAQNHQPFAAGHDADERGLLAHNAQVAGAPKSGDKEAHQPDEHKQQDSVGSSRRVSFD